MSAMLWQQCLNRLQDELPSAEFSMWIRPLQAELGDDTLTLFAPNRFVLDWVRDKYLIRINSLLGEFCGSQCPQLKFEVGNKRTQINLVANNKPQARAQAAPSWIEQAE